jgi:hypothetical protein
MTDDRMCRRRRLLGGALLAAGAAALACPRRQGLAQANRYSKERVGYRDELHLGRTCAKRVLHAGPGESAIVVGEVSPNGWCVQRTPATVGSWAGPA